MKTAMMGTSRSSKEKSFFAFSVQVCIGSGWSTGFLRKAKRSRRISFVKLNILNQVFDRQRKVLSIIYIFDKYIDFLIINQQ